VISLTEQKDPQLELKYTWNKVQCRLNAEVLRKLEEATAASDEKLKSLVGRTWIVTSRSPLHVTQMMC